MRTLKSAQRAALAVGMLTASYTVAPLAQDGALEEIIVTGSYIRGPATDAPSPVTVISREAFDSQGAATLWDVTRNLNINSGSTTALGTDGSNSDSAVGTANVNLRGLGQNATLVLFNGKRQVSAAQLMLDGSEYVDIYGLPMIAVERLEVLTDGGSALYGSDAIAGVVNYVLRTEFDGLEFRGDVQQIADAGSTFDATLGGLWGWTSNSGASHFVIGGEYFERDPVPITEASNYNQNAAPFELVGAGSSFAPIAAFGHTLNPAFLNTAVNDARRAAGRPVNELSQVTDPQCYALGFRTGYQNDLPGQPTSQCWEDVSANTFLEPGQARYNAIASFSHQFAPSAKVSVVARYAEDEIQRTDTGAANGLAPVFMMPVMNAANPITIGVPGLGSTGLGSQAAFAGNAAPTITNAPNSLANGGLNTPALVGFITHFPRPVGGGDERRNESQTEGLTLGLKGDFTLFGREFSYDTSLGYSANERLREDRVLSRNHMERALNGLGGPRCVPNGRTDFNFDRAGAYWNALRNVYFGNYAPGYPRGSRANMSLALTSSNQGVGDCQFLNPFLSAHTNSAQANSQELIDWVAPIVPTTHKKNELYVFDAVLTGDLFELPGGMARFAAGVQARKQRNQSFSYSLVEPGLQFITGYDSAGRPNAFEYGSDDLSFGAFYSRAFDNERRVNSVFTELSLPIIDSVETQLAVRYEDYDDIGGEVSPKLAASWRPIESLLLRGSYSRSFRAPNLGLIYNGTNSGAAITQDLLSSQAVRAGLAQPALPNAEVENMFYTGVGSPDLKSEHATTYSFGFIFTPSALDGLSVQMDYWRFDYEDKIVAQPFREALQEETDAFLSAVADPTRYVTVDSLRNDALVPFVPCDPRTLSGADRANCVVDPRAYQVQSVYRLNDGDLVNVLRGNVNAGSIVTDGVDVKIGYDWETSMGRFFTGLDYTYVRQYEISDLPGLENGLLNTGVFDAAGTSGDGAIARALPDHRGSATLSWGRSGHSATAIGRVIGGYDYLAYDQISRNFAPVLANAVTRTIDSYATLDLAYTYAREIGSSNVSITAAVIDVLEEDVPYVNTNGGAAGSGFQYDGTVYDPRGRRYKLTAVVRF